MDRRDFIGAAGLNILAPALAEFLPRRIEGAQQRSPSDRVRSTRKALMKVGHQHESSDDVLKFLAAFGVNHICSALPSERFDDAWSVEGLTKLKDRVESFGIKLDAVPLPLSSRYITKAENPNIMLGKSPERDREIDQICKLIRNASRAG